MRCSNRHLIEIPAGFIFAEKLNIDDDIITEYGIEKLKTSEKVSREKVYDFEVDHHNHRYFAGGFSNHNSGKTFLCLNIAREAQKQGYKVLWVDTENATDYDTFKRFGIQLDGLIYYPVNTVSQLSTYLVNMVDALLEAKKAQMEIDKYVIIIDSIGNLSTSKEVSDVSSGSDKADMTRARELKRLFRVCTMKTGKLKMPVIVVNHVYANIGSFFPSNTIGGGGGPFLNASLILELSIAQLKEDGDKAPKTGVIVTSKAKKSRMGIPNPVKFHISFRRGMNPYVGLEKYISWEGCGIDYGKIEKGKFIPSSTGRTIAVKHLGKHIPSKQLWTSQVFTKEILELINPLAAAEFNFSDQSSQEFDLDAFLPEVEDMMEEDINVDLETGEILE